MKEFYSIICVGKIKPASPLGLLWTDYEKRFTRPVLVHEIEEKTTDKEHKAILNKLSPNLPTIILDETGYSLTSKKFSNELEKLQNHGTLPIQFIIGGADGLNHILKEKANLLISFGKQTWPHKMVRIMLLEQLYRAQQIIAGHPYHRES